MALAIASEGSRATIGTQVLDEGDWLSLDGESGEIFQGKREIIRELPEAELATIQAWKLNAEALGSPKRAPTPS
jgi:pyruvate,orthophosphate dikinase